MMPDTNTKLPFARVLIEELEFIKVRRKKILESAQSTSEEHRGKLANEDPKDVVKEFSGAMEAGPLAQGWEPGRVAGGGPCQGAVGESGGAGVLGRRHPQRDFRDRSPARAGQPETPAFLRRPLNRLGRGLCRRLARDVDPTRGGPAQRRAQLDFSRIKQGEAVRFSGYRIGIQVAEIVDEVLRPLFDQLAIDFAARRPPAATYCCGKSARGSGPRCSAWTG